MSDLSPAIWLFVLENMYKKKGAFWYYPKCFHFSSEILFYKVCLSILPISYLAIYSTE